MKSGAKLRSPPLVAAGFLVDSGYFFVRTCNVHIPVSCQIDMPEKPAYNENIIVTNLSILSYASKLESALKACRGDK